MNNNKLKSIDLSKVPNLESLVISNNFLNVLEVKHLKKLKTLQCTRNRLIKLICTNLTVLEDLNCSSNFRAIDLTAMGHKVTLQGMALLNTKGCDNLRIVDTDLN